MTRISRLIWLMAAIQLGFGLAALLLQSFHAQPGPLTSFFRYQGSLFLVSYAAAEYLLSWVCWRLFDRGDPLRLAWLLITMAAGCRVAGLIVANIISGFAFADAGPEPSSQTAQAANVREIGLAISSPLNMALLAVGLLLVIRLYKRVGLLRRPTVSDWIPLSIVGAFIASQLFAFAQWLTTLTAPVTVLKGLSWITDPLVGVLLLEAILLRRAVVNSGGGLVARCWGAYVSAIFLTSLGDVGIWAISYGHVDWRYVYVNSCTWFLVAIAFALGPAYQIEAIMRARAAKP